MIRFFILSLAIFLSTAIFSQDTLHQQADTAAGKINTETKDGYYEYQSVKPNYDFILEMQRQNREKKKKQAWLYLGMGAFFFAVLVVGVVRRRKR